MKFDKYRFLTIAAFVSGMVLFSCTKEPMAEPDASFTIENIDELKAGVPVTFNFTGSGDFITVFSGDTLEQYQYYPTDKGAVVSDMVSSKTYYKQGTFNVTAIASSYGNWSEERSRNVVEQEITVIDSRTKMTDFSIKSLDIEGIIDEETSTISFLMSSLTERTNLVAKFQTMSSDATVYIDDVVQISAVTSNDYTDPVSYLVEAPDGTTQTYTTDITFFYPSDEKQLLTFNLPTLAISASINEAMKTLAVVVPAETDLTRVRVTASSSPLSSVSMQGKTLDIDRAKTVDISVNPTIITVLAEDLTTQDYELTTTFEE